MRIAVWSTGHEIADRVADALLYGAIPDGNVHPLVEYLDINRVPPIGSIAQVDYFDVNIAYGILRGTADVFRKCDELGKPWLHLDRGYFNPGHYDGYYRVSLKGTQQTTGLNHIKPDYDRLKALGVEMKPWRGFDPSKPVLLIPPTEHVREFFGLHPSVWWDLKWNGSAWKETLCNGWVERKKGEGKPIDFDDYSYVITFNSSVGWQALQAGIPCISDPDHSIVGAWFKNISSCDLPKMQHNDRERLFATMASLQMTLQEIRAGKLWELIQVLLSTSDTIAGSQSAQKLQPTAYSEGQKLSSIFASSNTAS